MPGIPTPQSYPQLLGGAIDAVTSRLGIRKLRVGGAILSILEATAQTAVRTTQSVFEAIAAVDLDGQDGGALDRVGASEDTPRRLQSRATGTVSLGDTSFVKRATKVYQGTPAPIVGSVTLNVEKSETFDAAPSSGQVYVGRNTPALEGPLAYSAKSDLGAYWALTVSPTARFHNRGEEVVLAQGGNRVVAAGTLVATPQGALSAAVQFSTVFDATLPDGEVAATGVGVVATVPGASGRVPGGVVTEYIGAVPYPGATVTNPAPFVNGRDTESDNDYRERIREARQTRQRATDLAVENAVLQAVSPDENKQVSSARLIRRSGRPALLVIDDGTGYEEVAAGVGLEVLEESAGGGEDVLEAIWRPVTKAYLEGVTTAPFALEDSAALRVDVGGEITTHFFDSSEFNSIAAASAYEVAASINGDPALRFSARTAGGGSRVVLYARAETNEDLQVVPAPAPDAAAAFAFPASRRYTALLYRNDRLLSKDGRRAVYRSEPFGLWSSFTGTQTLTAAVDQTPAATYSFTAQDFVDAATAYSLAGKNSLSAWVAVINRKIPGVTAAIEEDRVVLTSNKGYAAEAKIDITGGTLVTQLVFTTGGATGLAADYVLDRPTSQFTLATAAAPGDRFSLGSEWTRAFLETPALLPTTLADPVTTWWAVDGSTVMVPHGVGAATDLTASLGGVTDAGFLVRINAELTGTDGFGLVRPGDWLVLNDPSTNLPDVLRRAWRIVEVKDDENDRLNDLVIEKRCLHSARSGHGAVALAAGEALAVGGYTDDTGLAVVTDGTRSGRGVTNSAERYSTSTLAWAPAASMATARMHHTTTLLYDGRVLVAGGIGRDGAHLTSTELYTPGTDTWAAGPTMAAATAFHTATLLPSGRVLLAGGHSGVVALATSIEFNPGTNTLINAAAMGDLRFGHRAVLLPATAAAEANNVVVAGGYDPVKTAAVEVYDVATFSWAALTSMPEARAFMGLEVVDDDFLLVAGDEEDKLLSGEQASYTLYDVGADTWSASAALPGGFQFLNKKIWKGPSVDGDLYLLYGFTGSGGGKACASYRFQVSDQSWHLMNQSLWSLRQGVEKVQIEFAPLGDGQDNVLVVGGSSRGNYGAEFDDALRGTAVAHHEQVNGLLHDWATVDETSGLTDLPLPARGLTIARTPNYLQQAVVPAAANYTAASFAAALTAGLQGAEALPYRTTALRISTNSFDAAGDLTLVASDGSGPAPLFPVLLPVPLATPIRNLTGHFASIEAGNSDAGTPQHFRVHHVLQAQVPQVSDAARTVLLSVADAARPPLSGTTLRGLRRWDDGLNPQYWAIGGGDKRVQEYGNAAALRVSCAAMEVVNGVLGSALQIDSLRLGLRRDPHNFLTPHQPVVLATPYHIGPRDDLTVVVDQDTETKRFATPLYRRLRPATATYGSQIAVADLDGGTVPLPQTFGLAYDFNDFAVYMQARAKAHGADASRKTLWRFWRHGPDGTRGVLRYLYAAGPDAAVAVETVLTQNDTITGAQNTGSDVQFGVHVLLGSGGARTGATVRTTSRVAFASNHNAGVGSFVRDVYAIVGYQVVGVVRASAGGSTVLTLKVPNNGVVAQGPQSHGLAVNDVLWYEGAAPTATTLLSGAAAVTAVGVFNAGTGEQTVTIGPNVLHDGSSAWTSGANPGTVSRDGTGEVVWDPATAAGDLFRTTNPLHSTAYLNHTARVVAFGRQYLRLRGVDMMQFGDLPTPSWVTVGAVTMYSHFQAATQTATAVVAAVNALAAAADSTCPVSGTIVGTGAGILNRASWDDLDDADGGYRLTDGVNYVQRTIQPALVSQHTELVLRDAVSADLLTDNDWANEDVRIAPVLTPGVVRWLTTPAVSGLFTAAEVVASADGARVQLSSLTAGAAGAVEVQGGGANGATAAVVGAASSISRSGQPTTCVATVAVAGTAGFVGDHWVEINNTYRLPKTPFWSGATTASVGADGTWAFSVAPYTVLAARPNSRLQFERIGNYVAVHYPFGTNEGVFAETDVRERDYLYVRGRSSTDSVLPDVAAGNRGVFRVVRATVTHLGATFWIENPGGADEVAEAHLVCLTGDSVVPGDEWVVSTSRFGADNRRTWRVAEVGAAVVGGNQYANNSFRVVADGVVGLLATPLVIAPDTALLQVREGAPSVLHKQLLSVTPHPTDGALVQLQFDTGTGFGAISAAAGSVVGAADKLAFPAGVMLGVDGYAHSVGLVGEANRIVYGDAADRATYPGYAAAGATIITSGPKVKRVQLALVLRVKSGLASDDLADRARSAAAAVVNQSGNGEAVALSDVVAAVAAVGGVVAVAVVKPTYSSTNDVIPAAPDEKLLVLDLRADVSISFVGA